MRHATDYEPPPAMADDESPAPSNPEFLANCLRQLTLWLEFMPITLTAHQLTLSLRWGQVLRIDYATDLGVDAFLQNRFIFWKRDGGAIHMTSKMREDWAPLEGDVAELASAMNASGLAKIAKPTWRASEAMLRQLVEAGRNKLPPDALDLPPLAPENERPAPPDPEFAAARKAEIEGAGPVEWLAELFSESDKWGRLWRADFTEPKRAHLAPFRLMAWTTPDGVLRVYLSCKWGGEGPLVLE